MSNESRVMPAAWPSVLLVCKDCRKRRNGPTDLKPKAAASALKRAAHTAKPRPRVVLTTCLGPCPKHAMTLGAAGGAANPLIAIVSSVADIERAVPRLLSTSAGRLEPAAL